MAATGVSSAFEFGFDSPTPAFAEHMDPSTAHFTPPRRPDTPQLTLHNYRKFQHSPHLSSSPELDYKRVRRKASVANLAASPEQQPPFAWTSSCAPPAFFHSLAPHDLVPSSFLPPPPATPHARPTTGSPSLSSTVTTLQSTPTRTPILRACSSFEQRRIIERSALIEPLRTKRKFPSLKQAKRLPRRTDSGSGDGDGGLWEVYAAILEPPEQEVQEASTSGQNAPLSTTANPVQPEDPYTQNRAIQENSEQSLNVPEEKGVLGTSSFSLSKFEFPVPPGHDNWGGACVGDITVSDSPHSPATLHYQGTSFDLVNPHASLLLGGHEFETPAEIDGLLDDYFDNPVQEDNMSSYGKLPWSPSGQSLGAASDSSSRHARILYDDAASARRNILRVDDEIPPPPKVLLGDSPLGYKSRSLSPMEISSKTAPLPFRPTQSQPNAGLFGNMPSIGRVLGWGNSEPEQNNPSRLEEGNALQPADGPSATRLGLSVTGGSGLMRSFSRRQGHRIPSHTSDPFDLTLSEDSDGSKHSIRTGIPRSGLRVENEPTDQRRVEQVDSLAPDGPNSQATSTGQDTDPILKEILDGYDYTRVNQLPPMDFSTSPSVEYGRTGSGPYEVAPTSTDHLSPFTPKSFITDDGKVLEAQPPPTTPLPTPPAPAYHGQLRVYSGCSELQTSDRTYGETSQLLRITPAPEIRYPPYRSHSPCHPATCAIPGHVHVYEDLHPATNEITDHDMRQYYHNNKENNSPTPSQDSADSPEEARGFRHRVEEEQGDIGQARTFGLFDDGNGVIDRNLMRASSVFTADDESEWETQFEESQPVLRHAGYRMSLLSYADTSADGTNRFSVGPEVLKEPQAALISPRSDRAGDDAWFGDRRVMFQRDDDDEADTKKAISLLSDKILSHQAGTELGGSPVIDREQRKLDMMELERLRLRNPSAIRKASTQIADKSGEYFPKMFKPNGTHLYTQGPEPSPAKSPRKSFIRAFKPRKKQSSEDPASDRRALLAMSPSPMTNNLQFDSSMNTFVTIRDGYEEPHPGKAWWPHDQNPTMHALKTPHALESPSLLPSPKSMVSGRKAIDISRDASKSKRASRMFTGSSKPIELKMLRPTPNKTGWRPLTDNELASRQPSWQQNSNLQPGSALAKYAMREDVRRTGPVDPRLPSFRFFPEDKHFNKDWVAEREIISKTVLVQCCWFPPLALAFALGSFDFIIERKTSGRIKRMAPKQKQESLMFCLPLGCLVWAFIIVLIVTLCVWFKVYGGNSSPLY